MMMTTTSTMTMRPTIKAISSPREGPEEESESDEAGVVLSEAVLLPGTGVAPHGSFSAFAPAAADGFPPAASVPFTVMTCGTVPVHVDTESARPS
jgi:hypothetical protein